MAQSLAELLRQVSWGLAGCWGGCPPTRVGGGSASPQPRSPSAPLQAQSALLVPDPVSLVLDEDGTAVETEAFFQTLEDGTVLMALSKGQSWAASKVRHPWGGTTLACPICIPRWDQREEGGLD